MCATLVLGALKLSQAKAALSCSGTTFLSSNYKEASVGSDQGQESGVWSSTYLLEAHELG